MIVRHLSEEDFPRLQAFEREHLDPNLPEKASLAALRHFARSGHSFLAETRQGEARGFVLAQAVWQGAWATVLVSRILAADETAYEALLRALVKSAHDAGIYEVALFVREATPLAQAAASMEFQVGPLVLARKRLGKRPDPGGVLE